MSDTTNTGSDPGGKNPLPKGKSAEAAETKSKKSEPAEAAEAKPKKSEPAKGQAKEFDPFIKHELYPDAFALFSFRPPELSSIKDVCIFVLDTNTLLLPYTVETRGLAEIRRVYEQLIKSNRLIIPGQVAREFVSHRADKILDLLEAWHTIESQQPGLKAPKSYPILESLDEYKAVTASYDDLKSQKQKFAHSISSLMARIRSWNLDDPINLMYHELFTQDCVLDIALDKELVLANLEHRNLHRIPPGFGDKGKSDKGVGDLIIWYTILHLARQHKTHIAFVSHDEKKGDWVYNRNDVRLFARHELVDEFRRASDGKAFYDIRLADLLELFGTQPDIVEEVRKSETEEVRRAESEQSRTELKSCMQSLYGLLRAFQASMASYLSPIDFAGDPDKSGKRTVALEHLRSLYAYMESNRLLLPPQLYKSLEIYSFNSSRAISDFNSGLQRENQGVISEKDHWGEALEYATKANVEYERLISELRIAGGYQ